MRRAGFLSAALAVGVALSVIPKLAAQQAGPPLITAQQLRPVAHKIVECPQAPVALPGDAARWGVIYCTEHDGQMFVYRDGFFGIFPNSVKRFIVNANGFGGGEDSPPIGQKFSAVTYEPFSKDELESYAPGKNRVPGYLAQAKTLFMLTLVIDNGEKTQMIVADPEGDPFWVQPVSNHKFFGQAFYMASVDFLNKRQQQ